MSANRPGSLLPWRSDERWQQQHAKARTEIGGDPVFTYQSAHDPWFSSSYYFETERGVVVFDTQMCRSSAAELWEQIQANTSGEILCIINSHAHPDHFWGNTYFREMAPRAAIITSQNVLDDLRSTGPARVAVVPDTWGDEAITDATKLVYPEVAFDGRLRLCFDDLTLELWEVGPAETPVQVVGWIPEHRLLLAADVIQNRLTYYVSERSLNPWYQIVDDLQKLGPKRILTGHLGVAGPEVLDETKRWFAALLGLLSAETPLGTDPQDFGALDDDAVTRIVAEMRTRFPQWWDAMMFEPDESCLEFSLRGMRSEVLGATYMEQGRA
jgi:glyoxylase-like metal-dependent hydrolase (beta-lactamase superfamily II)